MTWTLWIAAIVLSLAGIVLLLLAIRGDRARGRRRCPRCWYDASGIASRLCPECGHEADSERAMQRTRRRPGRFVLAIALLIGAGGSATGPFFLDPTWPGKAPLWLLSSAVLVGDDQNDRLLGTLETRAGPDLGKLSGVGSLLHSRRLARIVAREARSGSGSPGSSRVDRMLATIAAMGPRAEGAVPVFRALLDDEREEVRRFGAGALGMAWRSAGSATVALARAAEQDPSVGVRIGAIRTLGLLGPEARASLPALERVARGTDDRVAAQAVQAIARVREAPDPLMAELLGIAGTATRLECARALGRFGDQAAFAAWALLTRMRDDPSADVRHECMSTMLRVNPYHPEMLAALDAASHDENRGIRFGAVQNLEVIAASRPIEPDTLVSALADPELSVRFSAAQALSRLWPAEPAGVRGAAAMLAEEDRGVRLWGVKRLREWGGASAGALASLRPLRWDEYEPLRAEAAEAIRIIERGN